jgi:deoxyadenosine/deoxycytidine kinase
MPIFALEGAAFVGKTTLLNYLKENYGDRVATIPESSEYVGGDKNFPDAPFKTLEEAKASTYFFIELEKRRCQDAINLYKRTGLPVIMDRTTPVSSLIFYSLLGHTDKKSASFYDSIFQHALEAFQTQIDKGNIFIPGGLIYINLDNRATFEKRLERKTKNGAYTFWDSYKFLNDKYQTLMRSNFDREKVLMLCSQNSSKNLEQLAKDTVDFVESVKPTFIPNIFRDFLGVKRNFVLGVSANEEKEFIDITCRCRDLMNNTNGYNE